MNNRTKKILAGIATVIIFVIGGIIYLTAPDEQKTKGGAGYEYDADNEVSNEKDGGYNTDAVDTDKDNQHADSNVQESGQDVVSQVAEADTEEPVDGDMIESTQEVAMEEEDYEVVYEFRKQQYLDEHFEKHGSEFDYENADEYLAGANRVINDPNSLYKIEEEDGDHIYYLESTNEFVVVSTDGYIRTYFKPSAGIDYFNRQ